MAKAQTRRSFLKVAPLAAALPVSGSFVQAWCEPLQDVAPTDAHVPFQLLTAQTIATTEHSLQSAPGVRELVSPKDISLLMNVTVEARKTAPEFEFHEHRDHIFQILAGSTRYELGGTPRNARQTRPSEWLAPASDGFTTVTLHQGDFLSIPRMTPHRRITEGQVTFILITGTSPG